jgi:3-deoxy-D-manno-octulosonic-acid transferase
MSNCDLRGAIWSRIYNILWYPALPFALVAAGGDAQSRRERLGGVAPEVDNNSNGKLRVWLHAASVGEIEGVRPVVRSLARARPDLEFVVTTMTPAGRDAARRRLNRICQLAPLDHVVAVHAFVADVRPVLVIITETELWPNFFLQSAAAGARIALINGRLSTRSMSRYRLIRPLLAHALKSASMVLTQTTEDAERFCTLGAAPERVAVTGNAKYEVDGDSPPLRSALAAFAEGRPILIAGSTGPGEEQIVLTAYRDLAQRFPSLALVLAPRHLQRIDEVERGVRATGLAYTRASDLNSPAAPDAGPGEIGHGSLSHLCTGESPIPPPDQGEARWGLSGTRRHPQVLLLDTMGELRALYHHATVAFVGGSLMPGRGGQSLAEPASASVPVLFGPYYENHRQVGDALIEAGAGHVVYDATQLADASAKWLTDEAARSAAGQRARAVIEQLAGATAITVRYLCALLPAS